LKISGLAILVLEFSRNFPVITQLLLCFQVKNPILFRRS